MANPADTNIGARVKTMYGVTAKAVAAGAGDNSPTTGSVVDRFQLEQAPSVVTATRFPGDSVADSAVVQIIASATLSNLATCTFKLNLQHGDASNGSDMADVPNDLQPAGSPTAVFFTLTDPGGGSTQTGAKEFDVSLLSLKRYVRVIGTPDLSAGATDTCFYGSLLTLGGFKHKPT